MTRRFEMVEGGSSKFWEITEQGSSFTVRYGKIGTSGQTQTKDFPSEEKARAAAAKLVKEKTDKGYVEVSAGDAPAAAPTPAPASAPSEPAATPAEAAGDEPAKKAKAPKAEKAPKAKTEKKALPPLVLAGNKEIGARAIANAGERLTAAQTAEEWGAATSKLPGYDFERGTVVGYLLEHGLFVPSSRLHAPLLGRVLMTAPPELALRVLAGIQEAWVERLMTEPPIHTAFVPVLGRLQQLAPDALRTLTLPPTLADVALLVRAIAGETLSDDEATRAMASAAMLLSYGPQMIALDADAYGRGTPVEPLALAAAFARIAGPHWIRRFPEPERLPPATAVAGLEGESLEEAARAVGLFNKDLLDARTEPPARFFEVAATVAEHKAQYLRVAGVTHATDPDQIPAGAELTVRPIDVMHEPRFGRLGTARLDAWAAHWLVAMKPQQPAHRPIPLELTRLALTAVPFGDAMRATLLDEPRPYESSPHLVDLHAYVSELRYVPAAGAEHVLRVATRVAHEREARGDRAEIVQGLRLLVCGALRALPADREVAEDVDALIRLGDGVHYDAKELVRGAVHRLPLARAERVVARTASELSDPFEELTYAREGSTEAAMRRFARLVASGRENETMWLHVRSGGLASLGPAFGPRLAEALSGETLSESFFSRLANVVHADALAHVREAVGKNVLDLASEMKKLCAELGGERVVVYAMSVGKPGRGLSRISGLPAGFSADDVPRGRGRKLMHVLTVDLNDVPELAARHPGARTLSIWIQGWGEAMTRAQALVTKTDAEIAALPITADAPTLELLRLEVPTEAFGKDPSERAKYARTLLYRKPGFLLGGPIWLQDGPWAATPTFVAQYDERIAIGANFGDVGICYSFEDHAEWQCH